MLEHCCEDFNENMNISINQHSWCINPSSAAVSDPLVSVQHILTHHHHVSVNENAENDPPPVQFTKPFIVTYYLILAYSYICTCIKGSITLSCGDSFCAGCVLRLIHKQKFNEENDDYIWTIIKITCSKCLMNSEISNSI